MSRELPPRADVCFTHDSGSYRLAKSLPTVMHDGNAGANSIAQVREAADAIARVCYWYSAAFHYLTIGFTLCSVQVSRSEVSLART